MGESTKAGGTRDVTASAPRHVHGPRALSALLPSITRPALCKHGPALGTLLADWDAVVGPTLAAVTEPVRLVQGTLTLACAGPVAIELQHVSPQILERVNAHFAGTTAQRLRIVQRALGPRPTTPIRPPPPRATEAAERAVAALPEGPLREALRALGEVVLARTPASTRRGGAA